MNLIVKTPHLALWGGREMNCAIGRGGLISAADKREGDGRTPAGAWAMREVFYRADRLAAPQTSLPLRATRPGDAWCDIDGDPHYNTYVDDLRLTRDEGLWRDDPLYDLVVVLGYNDDPVMPGKGSGIFLHLAREAFTPTAGCVALAREDLITVLRQADRASCVEVLKP